MSILFDRIGHVAVLRLNRPEVYNALNRELLHDLQKYVKEIQFDRSIRVVVITGSGSKAFCSGADLKERKTMSEQEVRQYIETIRDTFTMIENLPQPVIAAINGVALGGGTELALACDLRIMADHAMMGLTETSLGIIPGAGGTQRLPRLVGIGVAKELIYSARKVSAEEAKQIGLVNKVVALEALEQEAIRWADEIAENAPLALIQAKKAINQGMQVSIDIGLKIESLAYEQLIPTRDRQEGLQAFAEKRKPNYTGE